MHAETEQLLTVTVGPADFGIPVAHVRRIARGLRIVRVPGADAATVGVVHLSGELIAAFDVAALLHGEAHDGVPVHVLVDVGGETVDLLVGAVGPMQRVPISSMAGDQRSPQEPSLAVLDVATLIRHARAIPESA